MDLEGLKRKITRGLYTNKKTGRRYERYKIRIPKDLRSLLRNYDRLYFNINEDEIHITTEENENTIHSCKIQKNRYKKNIEYSINLSKKIFNFQGLSCVKWNIFLENNEIKDITLEFI